VTLYQLWPDTTPYTTSSGTQAPYTLGTQFSVTQSCDLTRVRWYSPPGATALPAVCGVWDITAQAVITEDAAPSWQLSPGGGDAVPGNGWVYCDVSAAAVTLAPGVNYAAAVFQPQAGVPWWATAAGYWTAGSGLGGAAGITSGPLSAPNTNTSVNGQGCYDTTGTWAFPGAGPGNGEVFYVDVEVSMPITANGGPWKANGNTLTTLNVVPVTAGDLLVLGFQTADSTTFSSAVSGGGVTTWHNATGYRDTPDSNTQDEIWWGVITATGAATITVTNTGITGWGRLWAREFTGLPSWALLAASPAAPATGSASGSGLTVNYPSLSGNGLYVGQGDSIFGTMTGGSTSGFTYDNNNNNQEDAWNPAAVNAAPVSAQSNTGGYITIAALFGLGTPAGGKHRRPQVIPVLAAAMRGR
jgi:hypothetical protein